MTITYWNNFAKRKNSTMQPSVTGTDVTVTLKEGTSIEKPTFILTGNLFTCNYVKAFNHYYFVDDIKSVRNSLCEIECSMDVLATYKSEIGSYTALIERSASFYDSDYPDPAVAVQNDVMLGASTTSVSRLSDTGKFALTVLNNAGSGTGFTVTYFVGASTLQDIARYINTDWGSAITPAVGDGANGILQWLQATFLKTGDCVVDCRWLPITDSAYSGDTSNETIVIGVDSIYYGGNPVKGDRLVFPHVSVESGSVSIPHYYSDFRKYAPYTTAKLYIPCYGIVDINTIDFPHDAIYWIYYIDPQTGDAAVVLCADSGYSKTVAIYNFNISVQCPVGRVGTDVTGFMQSGLATSAMIAGAMALPSKFSTAAGIATGASAINTLGSALGTTSSVNGRQGGRVMSVNRDFILSLSAKVTQDPTSVTTESGRPCMATHQISTCSGFVKCVNADVEISGMGSEKEAVNEYLNGGFYYE